MKRINSVDTIRGLSIWIMVYGHIILFWLRPEDEWLKFWLYAFLQPIGATGFLFISGVSASLAFKKNQYTKKASVEDMRNMYLLRALFILVIGLIFNLFVAIMYGNGNLTHIWSWNALQTIGISLLLLWPLLKTSKKIRLIIALFAIVSNQILLIIITSYNGDVSMIGIIDFLLFYPSDQYIILNYFGILVIGSVIGDIIFEQSNREESQRFDLFQRNKGLLYILFIGISVIIFGLMFQFPNFLIFNSISSTFYSIGIIVVALIVLIIIEEMQYFKPKKSYRYLYFYSYYSFTIFLGHELLLMLFYHQLDAYLTIWIAIIVGNILLGILFRTMYTKMGPKLSLKASISILSFLMIKKFNKRKYKTTIVQ